MLDYKTGMVLVVSFQFSFFFFFWCHVTCDSQFWLFPKLFNVEFLPYKETKIWVSFETLRSDKWPTSNVLWKRTSFTNFWSRNCKLSLQPMTFNSFSFILQPITHNFFCLVWKVKVVIICWFLHFFALKASWTFIPLYTCVSQFNLQFLFPCYTR